MLTCSEFGAAMGISTYETRNQLIKKKLNRDEPEEINDFTQKILQYGTDVEPFAIADVQAFLSVVILNEGLHSNPLYQGIAGSHDGKVLGQDMIVEIKSKINGVLPDIPDPAHIVQCIGNMEMREAGMCVLVYWAPGQCRCWWLKRNEKMFKSLIWPRLLNFMCRMDAKEYFPRFSPGEKARIIKSVYSFVSLNPKI